MKRSLSPTSSALLLTLTLAATACGSSDPPYDQAGAAGTTGDKNNGASGSQGGVGGAASGGTGAGSGTATGGGNGAGSSSGGGGGGATTGGAATAYNVDVTQTSVSGLSSGAYMAVQFHVAFSSIMKGAAIFAGGPFYCAQGQLTTAETQCMYAYTAPSVTPFVTATNSYAATGAVDSPKNLASQHVFLFGGASDNMVNPVVMDALSNYYASFIDKSQIKYESRHAGAAHTMPTVSSGGACGITADPWIGNCNYDGAGMALAQIYGTLAPKATAPSGEYVTLDQSKFIATPKTHSIADTGYAYVPASCKNGEPCKVHVAFHGCKQEASGTVGDKYYKTAGYNEWADTNHIIVLYPQTTTGGSAQNPNACWDWWGYDSADYAKKTGPQMAMVRKMIDFLAGK
jgi:poly(3-hydroxybutyrate) depolymerase